MAEVKIVPLDESGSYDNRTPAEREALLKEAIAAIASIPREPMVFKFEFDFWS
jgi:hypothetical protein